MRFIDIFSPNGRGARALFGITKSEMVTDLLIEQWSADVVNRGIGSEGDGCIVVRAAERGCYILSRKQEGMWLSAFYSKGDQVDATGAGNTFLGAFTIGLIRINSIVQAAMFGRVGASFVVEQVGPTTLGKDGQVSRAAFTRLSRKNCFLNKTLYIGSSKYI